MSKYRDLIVGVIFLALAGFYLSQAELIVEAGSSGQIGPQFFPEVIAGLTILLSVILIGMSLSKLKREAGKPVAEAKQEDKPNNVTVVLTILLIFGFVALFEPLGFMPTAASYLFLQFNVAAPKSQKTLKHQAYFLIGSLVLAFGINYIFVNAFNVMLPQGILDLLMY